MDPAQVLQSVLSIIPSPKPPQPGRSDTTVSGATSDPSTSQLPVPQAAATPVSLSQMFMAVLSMAGFWDWVKLFLIGAFLETCRRGSAEAWVRLLDYVWVTADLDWDGDGSQWLMYFLSQKKVFQKACNIEVCTLYFGAEGVCVNDLGDGGEVSSNDQVAFLPSLSRTYTLMGPTDMLKIRMLTRDSDFLCELLKEARKAYKAANGHLINVYVAQGTDEWTRVAAQQKRPMSSVILDPGVLDLVLEDAKDFLNSRKWYADRGIPFRRGYLLYGAPGSGKTSMIHSIAGELGLHIYILSLTVMSLNDDSLKALISHLPKSCILLMEDIDAAFARGIRRRDITGLEAFVPPTGNEDGGEGGDGSKGPGGRDGGAGFNGVTLSGLLNALDGIAAQEGRILFATTNDPALLRPGRLDLHVEFGLASEHQAKELFKRFYTSSSDVPVGDEDGGNEENEKDPGYTASREGSPGPETTPTNDSKSLTMPEGVKSVYVGMTRTGQMFQLSSKKAVALAERFAAVIPPRTFSMATLQGYLMAYKVRPYVAVEEAPAWVKRKMREKAAQAAVKRAGGKSGTATLES
ncbi:P-loop containing nucleoside triphosphate hydrolase protein [Ganoderma leucocontextum]|nr:P-loop containing nucleoside triphosphate hydrolase protein [Ganoderma leucocontextum]